LASSIVERGIRRLGDTGASVMEYAPLLMDQETTDQVPTSSNGTIATPKNYGTTKNEEH